ncbi:hypothetical protein GW17_00031867 [Ensete ventricosum]|nr:hypothetical protein GW17_00031867 [Ensete ventricosum]
MASSVAEKLAGVRVANGEGWASVAPNLRKNLGVLSSEEVSVSSKLHPIPSTNSVLSLERPTYIELAKMLLHEGQKHLFDHWPEPGVDDGRKKSFFDQVIYKL